MRSGNLSGADLTSRGAAGHNHRRSSDATFQRSHRSAAPMHSSPSGSSAYRRAKLRAAIRTCGHLNRPSSIETGKAAPRVQMSVSKSSRIVALHSLIRFMPSRGPQPQRAVIFHPLSRASARVSIIKGHIKNPRGDVKMRWKMRLGIVIPCAIGGEPLHGAYRLPIPTR